MSLPKWPSRSRLHKKFHQHGQEFPYWRVDDFEASSINTVVVGTRFTYTDPSTGAQRLGYYDVAGNRFTAVTGDGRRIVTHFAPTRGEKYVEELLDSTYT